MQEKFKNNHYEHKTKTYKQGINRKNSVLYKNKNASLSSRIYSVNARLFQIQELISILYHIGRRTTKKKMHDHLNRYKKKKDLTELIIIHYKTSQYVRDRRT